MHELSIAENIVDIAREAVSSEDVQTIREMELEIGTLSGIEIEALEFALEVVVRGTILEGTKITIDRVSAEGHCSDCGATAPMHDFFSPCAGCGGFSVTASRGTELRVRALYVDE